MSRRLLLLGLGVAVGEAAALAVAARRWLGEAPASNGSSAGAPASVLPASETTAQAPAFVDRRGAERRSGEDRRKRRDDLAERIARATERRSRGERRSGIDRRRQIGAEPSPV